MMDDKDRWLLKPPAAGSAKGSRRPTELGAKIGRGRNKKKPGQLSRERKRERGGESGPRER